VVYYLVAEELSTRIINGMITGSKLVVKLMSSMLMKFQDGTG
jgi:hypothetical protein